MPRNEFNFEQEATNGGTLTYGCIELSINSNEDEFTESELQLIHDMVDTLNETFQGLKEEE